MAPTMGQGNSLVGLVFSKGMILLGVSQQQVLCSGLVWRQGQKKHVLHSLLTGQKKLRASLLGHDSKAADVADADMSGISEKLGTITSRDDLLKVTSGAA